MRRFHSEAGKYATELLNDFGCRFPKRSLPIRIGIFTDAIRVKNTLRHKMLDDLHSMSAIADTTLLRLLAILDRLVGYFYAAQDKRVALVSFRMLQWSQRHGLNDYTSVSLAAAGLVFSGVLGDAETAASLGKKALGLEQCPPRSSPCIQPKKRLKWTTICDPIEVGDDGTLPIVFDRVLFDRCVDRTTFHFQHQSPLTASAWNRQAHTHSSSLVFFFLASRSQFMTAILFV